jgi:hypothetical protein
MSLAPDNIVISSFPPPRENGMNVANGESQNEGGEDTSPDGGDASSTDETVLAEPGCTPYDLVAVPPPSDATAAQMLTEQAVSQNASVEHAQVTRPALSGLWLPQP